MSDAEIRRADATTRAARLRRTVQQTGPGEVALYAVLVVMAGFYLVPIESGLVTSIKTNTAIIGTAPYAPPGANGATLEKWGTAVDALLRGMGNSLLYAVPATVISAVLGSITAYGLTMPTWKRAYKAPLIALIVAGIFIPYQAVLVPLTQFW